MLEEKSPCGSAKESVVGCPNSSSASSAEVVEASFCCVLGSLDEVPEWGDAFTIK